MEKNGKKFHFLNNSILQKKISFYCTAIIQFVSEPNINVILAMSRWIYLEIRLLRSIFPFMPLNYHKNAKYIILCKFEIVCLSGKGSFLSPVALCSWSRLVVRLIPYSKTWPCQDSSCGAFHDIEGPRNE